MSTCKCGRPRYTLADIGRWCDELGEHARSADPGGFNPAWSLGICWAMHDVACNMKPLASTDEMRALAQALLTGWQRFASAADGSIDPALEERAKALGLDVEAWLR